MMHNTIQLNRNRWLQVPVAAGHPAEEGMLCAATLLRALRERAAVDVEPVFPAYKS